MKRLTWIVLISYIMLCITAFLVLLIMVFT